MRPMRQTDIFKRLFIFRSNLLSNIFKVLPRFRYNFTAILADIKQAFLNVFEVSFGLKC